MRFETPNPMTDAKTPSDSLEAILARMESIKGNGAVNRPEPDHANEIARLMLGWNAPRRQADKTDLDFSGEWGETLAKVKAKLGTGFLIALHGLHGGGKTQLAVELMRHQIQRRIKSALFTTSTEFFMGVKATYRQDAQRSEADYVETFCRPALLVVDEIEKRGQSEWENGLLFHLFNRRYNAVKDTLLISNLAADDLAGHLGTALVSRLNETGGMIHANWKSRR